MRCGLKKVRVEGVVRIESPEAGGTVLPHPGGQSLGFLPALTSGAAGIADTGLSRTQSAT